MKFISKLSLLAAWLLCASVVVAQDIRIGTLTPETTEVYHTNSSQSVLRMPFGKNNLLNPALLRQLKGKTVKAITLLYTDYPAGNTFDSLNQRRLDALRQVWPEVFEQKGITWIVCRQTGCATRQQAERMVHGFVFTLEKAVHGQDTEVIAEKSEVVTERQGEEPVEPQDLPAVLPTEKVDGQFLLSVGEDYEYVATGEDPTTTRVIERNQWKNMVLVCDWTSSMYEYTTQLLYWHVQNNSKSQIRRFVFFNDGDTKLQNEKVAGNTGGIYAITSDSLRRVIALMKHVKRKGNGGDTPENNIEALLFTLKKFPDAQDIVMIADGGAKVRDISLLPQVTRPVHVIACKVLRPVLLDYIRIARSTGGSLHTTDVDYTTPEALDKLEKEILDEIEQKRKEDEEKKRLQGDGKKKGLHRRDDSQKKMKKWLGRG